VRAALLLLALSAPALAEEKRDESRLFRALGYATFVTKGGDLISTEYALAVGGHEVNPLLEHRGARLATSIAVPALANWGTAVIYQKHPRLAFWARVALVAAWGAATAHNLR